MAQNGGGGDRRKRSVNMTIMAAEKGGRFWSQKTPEAPASTSEGFTDVC